MQAAEPAQSKNGWYWQNTDVVDVEVALKLRGDYVIIGIVWRHFSGYAYEIRNQIAQVVSGKIPVVDPTTSGYYFRRRTQYWASEVDVKTPAWIEWSMALGFVLISASPGKEHDVYNALLKVSEIVELHPLFGEYDMIAKLEAPDFDALGHVIVNRIRSIDGVVDSKTLTGTKF